MLAAKFDLAVSLHVDCCTHSECHNQLALFGFKFHTGILSPCIYLPYWAHSQISVTSSQQIDLVSSQKQSQSQVGIIGGVVAGVLVVVALVVLVALAIVYKKRKGSFTLHSKVKSRDRTDTQQFGYELQNPLYSG